MIDLTRTLHLLRRLPAVALLTAAAVATAAEPTTGTLLDRLYPGNATALEERLAPTTPTLPVAVPVAVPAADRATTGPKIRLRLNRPAEHATVTTITLIAEEATTGTTRTLVRTEGTTAVLRLPPAVPRGAGNPGAAAPSLAEFLSRLSRTRTVIVEEKPAPPAVPAVPTAAAGAQATSGTLAGARTVDVNKAQVHELMTVLGLDARRARLIVEFRTLHGPFRAPQDLEQVNGLNGDMIRQWESDERIRFE